VELYMPPRNTPTQKLTSNPLTPTKLAELEASKPASKDVLRTQLIYNSWMIDKPTGHKRTLIPQVGNTKRRRMALPRGYRSKEYDVVECYTGEDLNAIIYKYYQTLMSTDIREEAVKKDKIRRGRVDKSGSAEMDGWSDGGGFGINYVAGEGIDEKRWASCWSMSVRCKLTANFLDTNTLVRHPWSRVTKIYIQMIKSVCYGTMPFCKTGGARTNPGTSRLRSPSIRKAMPIGQSRKVEIYNLRYSYIY